MPIKGISDQRRLPRLGHLRLGIKKVSKNTGKEYPAEVDYFVIDPKTPDPRLNEKLKSSFRELYGDQPKMIKVMFPPVPVDLFFPQWYKRYGSSTLVKCKGDGEIATTTPEFAEGLEKIGDDERGFIQVRCLGPECPYQQGDKKACQRMASLQVILPELVGMGVWQINTGSYNSIVNVNSAIAWLQGLCGRYAMIPVNLMRVPTDIQYEGKKSKHYILQVDQETFSIGDIQKFAQIRSVETALIPAPDESKDALFYDGEGEKPANGSKQVEIQEETAPGDEISQGPGDSVVVKKDVPEEPKKASSVPDEQTQQDTFESIKLREEIKAKIGRVTDPKSVVNLCNKLKNEGTIDKLRPEDRADVSKYAESRIEELGKGAKDGESAT